MRISTTGRRQCSSVFRLGARAARTLRGVLGQDERVARVGEGAFGGGHGEAEVVDELVVELADGCATGRADALSKVHWGARRGWSARGSGSAIVGERKRLAGACFEGGDANAILPELRSRRALMLGPLTDRPCSPTRRDLHKKGNEPGPRPCQCQGCSGLQQRLDNVLLGLNGACLSSQHAAARQRRLSNHYAS